MSKTSSNFKRRAPKGSQDTSSPESAYPNGVKPSFSNNLGILSSGNKDLDKILNGGINLGSIVCYAIDDHSNFANSLIAYLIAENLSHLNHFTGIININGAESDELNFNVTRLLEVLPLNRDYNAGQKQQSQDSRNDETESSGEQGVDSSGNNLKIAWQYRKYLNQNHESGEENRAEVQDIASTPYCCSFDLSQRLQRDLIVRINYLDISLSAEKLEDHFNEIYQKIVTFVVNHVQKSNQCAQIIIPCIDDIFLAYCSATSNAYKFLSRFLLRVKQFIWNKKVNVAISYNSKGILSASANAFEHFGDLCMSVESFASRNHAVPEEFRLFHGFLSFRKFNQRDLLSPHKISATRFGLVRDRRRLSIEALHLPPENSRAFVKDSATSTALSAPTTAKSTSTIGNEISRKVEDVAIPTSGEAKSCDHDHKHDHEPQDAPSKSNSLKSSLAALRASREAAKQQALEASKNNVTLQHQPVNISFTRNLKSNNSSKEKSNIIHGHVPEF